MLNFADVLVFARGVGFELFCFALCFAFRGLFCFGLFLGCLIWCLLCFCFLCSAPGWLYCRCWVLILMIGFDSVGCGVAGSWYVVFSGYFDAVVLGL